MTRWEGFKVQDLKEECKARQISITGLKLKRQFVDKLVEYEVDSQEQDSAEVVAEDEEDGSEKHKTNNTSEEVEDGRSSLKSPETQANEQSNGHQETSNEDAEALAFTESDKNLSHDSPAAAKVEDREAVSITNKEANEHGAETTQKVGELGKEDVSIPQSEQPASANTDPKPEEQMGDAGMDNAEAESKYAQIETSNGFEDIVDHNNNNERQVREFDQNEESRKRKRRSVTPPPDAEEIRKKARAMDGESFITKQGGQSPSYEAKDDNVINKSIAMTSMDKRLPDGTHASLSLRDETQGNHREEAIVDTRRTSGSPSVDEDSTLAPALHAATRSLYMRNFKRPLNVQNLRSHVLAIAQGSSSIRAGEDPIKFWHVNNIRSHAFVTFTTISAASRVRIAMHDTRFPNEPQREPLWIDFVPEDKVEEWVEQETGAGSRTLGRNSVNRFDVVYDETNDGVQATFQEIDPSSLHTLRPGIGATINNRAHASQRQASYTASSSNPTMVASDVHPDRAALVPESRSSDRHRQQSPFGPAQSTQRSDQGTGFRALDDLFSSTTTKPKLYFKLQPQEVVDERFEMIRDLYSDRGTTGDPGMKRYTFEKDRGREMWVDNGPEFGHGRKGQERLTGFSGRGRGGYRGRGAVGRSYRGDSYRGGGRR